MKTREEGNQRSHTVRRPAAERLDVQVFEKCGWDVTVKAGPAPDFQMKRRVLTLSMDDNVNREESSLDSIVTRAIAWAVLRVRGAASSLGTA